MGIEYGGDLNLNVRATSVDATKQDLKDIAKAINEVAAATKVSAETISQINSSLQLTSQTSGQVGQSLQIVIDNLIGLRDGVNSLVEIQDESNQMRERLNEAAQEAKRLREELAQQRKEMAEIKGQQDIINQTFSNPLRTATQQLLGFFREMGRGPAIMGAFAVGIAGLAVGGLALVKSMGEDAREAENLANRLGLTAEQAMRLRAEAQMVEVNVHSLEFASRTLGAALEDSSGSGKKASDALSRLGIQTLTATGEARPLGQVLLEVLKALSNVPEAAERAREGSILLGRSSKEIMPLIANYKELEGRARELGIGVNENVTKELLDANKEINTMVQALKDLGRQAAAKIAPIVISITRVIRTVTSNTAPGQTGDFSGGLGNRGMSDNTDEARKLLEEMASAAPHDLFGIAEDALKKPVIEGRRIAQEAVAAFGHTTEGLRQELRALHSDRDKILEELNKAASGQGGELKAKEDATRLKAIEAREAQIQDQLKVKSHDRAAAEMVQIDHEMARLGLETEQEFWRKSRADTETAIKNKRDELLVLNDRITNDKRAEYEEEISLLDKSDKDYETQQKRLVLELAKLDAASARERAAINVEADNKLEVLNEQATKRAVARGEKEVKTWQEAIDRVTRLDEERNRRFDRADEVAEDSKRRHADAEFKMEEQRVTAAANLGIISEEEKTRRLNVLYQKQEDDERKHIQEKIKIAMQDPDLNAEQIARFQAQLEALDDRRRGRQLKNDESLLKDKLKIWSSAFNQIDKVFASGLRGFVQGTETFGQAWRKMAAGMVMDMEMGLIKMGLKWVQHQIMKLVIADATNKGVVASDAVAAEQSNQISLMKHLKEIYRTAKSASAHVYDSVAAIPHVGWALAPFAADAAFAAVMALGAITAEHGAVLPNKETIGFLHPREMVLPAHISEGLQSIFSGGGPSGQQAPIFAPRVQAFDSRGVDRVLQAHGKKFMNLYQRQLRYGNV